MASQAHWKNRILLPHTLARLQETDTRFQLPFLVLNSFATRDPCSPVFDHFLIVAKVTKESRVEQMHDGVLFPSNIQIHRHPVVGQRCAKGPGGKRDGHFSKPALPRPQDGTAWL